jgi:FdhD protein
VTVHGASGSRASDWGIAAEVAVEITINGAPWTVCMATPTDLEELATGLALTEGRIAQAEDVTGLEVIDLLGEYRVALEVRGEAAVESGAHTATPTGACGLCGLESLAALHARLPNRSASRTSGPFEIDVEAILRAFEALPAMQPLNAATRSVHAAAWCAPDGGISLVREDVGRHNALDKLIGALARAGRLHEDGFVVMTSRCSYELVAKCAHTGAQLLATWSAPTSLALHWAATVSLSLCSAMRTEEGLALITFPQEVVDAG